MGSTGANAGAGLAVARADAIAPARSGGSSGSGGAHLADPLHPLRRLGVGAALDLAFELLRFRFRTLVGLAACLFLPVQLLDLVLRLTVTTTQTGSDAGSSAAALLFVGGSSDWAILTVVLQAVALSILGICVGRLVREQVLGERAEFRTLLADGLRRSWVATVIVVLSACIRLPLSCIPVVGWIVGDALVFVASIAAGAERLGPIAAIGRSLRLARGAFGPAMVMALGSLAITQIIRASLYAGPAVLISTFAPPEGLLILVEQLASLIQLVAQPLTACIAASSYLLLRCRVEGLDLERRATEREQQRGSDREPARALG